MKDGTSPHLAYKPEHAVDLDSDRGGNMAEHPADEGDTTTLWRRRQTLAVDVAPPAEDPAECVP